METHHQNQQTQPSHRRRQSTLVYSTTKFDGSLSLDSRTATLGDGAESPTSSLSQNRSLKPPTTPTNNNRNSFGIWSGSKSAASTPNLGNVNRAHSPNDFSSSSITTASASGAATRTQGSGEGSAASIDSSGSSFHQRRKRSESIGGIKNTAGNITRIVKKSSSNFLKKFVKSFDDKDAPPTPSIPSSNNTSSVKPLPPPPHGARSTTMPELPTLSSQLQEQGGRTGPLDTPPPLSPLMGQELETHFASINTALPQVNGQSQQTAQNSNVESWLKSTADNERAKLSANHEGVSSAELSASLALLSQQPARLDRRESKVSDDLNDLDNDEDEEDEDEDEDLPINITNRLSKLYESGSMHLNQSQTSLYYSTKSNLSDAEAAELESRRTSLAQDALGYSLGLSGGNPIRFSLNSIGSLHLTPLPSLSRSNSTPSSPGFPKIPVEYQESKLPPRRPVSMFIPLSTSSALDSDELDEDNKGHGHQRELSVDIESTPRNLSIAGTPTQSSLNLLVPGGVREGPRTANRPITICVSADDANRIPFSSTSSIATLLTPDMSLEEQREFTVALAIRTSKRCFDEDESFIKRGEIAEYLGTPKPFQRQVLMHYMDHFDFTGKRLDFAFRALCQKLVLKGETQEVDRILEAFAERYVVCNPRTLLGGADLAKDVVHAITYSILLLNTDLHIVQQSSKMSRSAFIKNTLQVVQSQSLQSSHSQNGSNLSEDSGNDTILELPRSLTGESLPEGLAPLPSSKKRTPSVKSWKSGQSHQSTGFSQVLNSSHHQNHGSKMGTDAKANGGYGNGKWWQQELEGLLKDIYAAVKQHQILLPVSPATLLPPRSKSNHSISSPPTSPTISGFGSSIFSSNRMSRLINPSSSSSSLPYLQDSGSGNGGFGLGLSGRRNSVSARTKQLRSEAIQRLNAQAQSHTTSDVDYLSLSAPSSTSSNLNVRHSMVGHFMSDSSLPDLASSNRDQNRGPAGNRDLSFLRAGGDQSQHSSTSRLSTLTMTTSQTNISTFTSATTPSASQNSLASLQSPAQSVPITQEDYQQQSHKKQHGHDLSFSQQPEQRYTQTQLQKDQVLQQHVHARYRMEGILWRKHLLERSDKKAQHRAWRQLLVVVDTDQGTLSMFRSDGNLPKPPPTSHGHGSAPTYLSASSSMGDYEADVPLFDEIPLQHTITNILPPPGYSSSRRHVFAVQLFTGAVYLFQANTPQECEAWARTCNYWAARTSKEPLVGGVVNMEYGWGRVLEELARLEEEQEQLQQHYLAATSSSEGGRSTPGSDISGQSHVVSAGKPMSTSSAKSFSGTADSMTRLKVAMDLQSTHPEHITDKAPPRSGGGSDISLGVSSGRGRSASIRSGTRGSVSSGSGVSAPGFGGGMGSPAALGDSLTLFEWTAPMPTMSVSRLSEEEQMYALRKYVSGLDANMESHQEHRAPMTRLFLQKSSNYAKAFNNWEKRSRYLLKETVKYQIYVECLEQSLQFQQQLQMELDSIRAQQEEQERLEQGFVQGQGGHEHIQEGLEIDNDLEVELAELVVRDVPV